MDKKLFTGLFLAFIASTIVGTLSHELGHYSVARFLEIDAHINYNSTYFSNATSFSLSDEDSFLIRLGGPIQTMLTGIIGISLMFLFRNRFYGSTQLSFRQWAILFVALFWLRFTANFFIWMISSSRGKQVDLQGDEIKIAHYLGLPEWSIISFAALAGVIVSLSVIFKFIPTKQRFTFVLAGITGGAAGYLFWLVLFGKYIMP